LVNERFTRINPRKLGLRRSEQLSRYVHTPVKMRELLLLRDSDPARHLDEPA
jgi:hypothetical protein